MVLGPVADGCVIPGEPATLFSLGQYHKVPMIVGGNADEGTWVARLVQDWSKFRQWAKKQYGDGARGIVALYPRFEVVGAKRATARAWGDHHFLLGMRTLLREIASANKNVYQYYFERESGIGRRTELGVFHGAEIPYVFGTLPDSPYGTNRGFLGDFSVYPDSYTGYDAHLSNLISAAWVRFARSGDPNGPDLPEWPAFRTGKERYLNFGDRVGVKSFLRKKQLDWLQQRLDR
jgi:para-nitrobenzyl esterase